MRIPLRVPPCQCCEIILPRQASQRLRIERSSRPPLRRPFGPRGFRAPRQSCGARSRRRPEGAFEPRHGKALNRQVVVDKEIPFREDGVQDDEEMELPQVPPDAFPWPVQERHIREIDARLRLPALDIELIAALPELRVAVQRVQENRYV